MKKALKWFGIIVGAVVVLVVLVLLIAPFFVDVNKFKPTIEKSVKEATGRQFVLGGDLELSLFPWAGITVTDVSLGNPEGFESEDFATFSEFEVRMKLLPLLSREVQVKHVVLKGLRLVLEKNKNGRANWEFASTGEAEKEAAPAKEAPPSQETGAAGESLPIGKLEVGEISVSDGTVLYIDRQSDVRKELSDVNVRLSNISFDTPIQLSLSGKLDSKPFSLEGKVGPLGATPGKGNVGMNLTASIFDILELKLDGQVTDPASAPAYQMQLSVSPFSPRRLIKEMAPDAVISSSDPSVLEKLGLDVEVSGDTQQVELLGGKLLLDDTTTTFQAKVKDFSKPDISCKVHMDALNLGRYLPKTESTEEAAPAGSGGGGAAGRASESTPIDYTPLRKMVVDGSIEIDELKAGGGTFRKIAIRVAGAGGKFKIDPLTMSLYEGALSVKGNLDVSGKTPKSAIDVNLENMQVEPLLKDFIHKDFITGTTLAQISLSMTGDGPEQIKQTLNGKGNIQFNDGAIRHVNLLGMIQNLQAAFGSGGAVGTQETEFSEFQSQFTIISGVVNTTNTTLSSPVLRVNAKGNADLVKETVDFRVDPTYINPKNQKESGMSISGNQVPVLITGTFSDPKFKPDLKSAAKKVVTDKLKDKLGEVLGGSKTDTSESGDTGETQKSENVEDTVKGLLKGLPFGK